MAAPCAGGPGHLACAGVSPRTAVAALALMTLVSACDTGDGRSLREPTPEQRAAVPTTTTTTTSTLVAPPADLAGGSVATTTAAVAAQPFSLSARWSLGSVIEAPFTCDGEDRSPLVTWTAPPAGTVELALVLTDDDAPGYVHWAVAGIPPTAGEKGEGATITGAVEGVNSGGSVGWLGPCPPAGETHTYRLTMYALNQQAELPERYTGADLQAVAGSAALAVAEVTATYTRSA